MMHSVVITGYAIRQLKKINKQMITSIKEAITELAQNPRPHNHIKLTNVEAYRIRVGNKDGKMYHQNPFAAWLCK